MKSGDEHAVPVGGAAGGGGLALGGLGTKYSLHPKIGYQLSKLR